MLSGECKGGHTIVWIDDDGVTDDPLFRKKSYKRLFREAVQELKAALKHPRAGPFMSRLHDIQTKCTRYRKAVEDIKYHDCWNENEQ